MAYRFAGHWGSSPFLAVTTSRPLAATDFTVYLTDGITLATLYADRTKALTVANPRTTNSLGNGEFYADPGDYIVTCNGASQSVTVSPDTVETYLGARRSINSSNTSAPFAETIPRWAASTNLAALTTQILAVYAVEIPPRTVVSSATFVSGATALATATNRWFCLMTGSTATPTVLATTADAAATAWAANTVMTTAFTSTYTTGNTTDWYYMGIMVKATTVPTLVGAPLASVVTSSAFSPTLAGISSTLQTIPPTVGAIMAAVTNTATLSYGALL